MQGIDRYTRAGNWFK